jgi:hypothetical protein
MVNKRDERNPVSGQDRISELMHSMFTVNIEMTDTLTHLLTPDEKKRLARKLERVIVPLTQDQCVGMARGTIKYPTDDYTPNQLMMHMMEEIRDQVNYVWMWRDAINQETAWENMTLHGKVEITEE